MVHGLRRGEVADGFVECRGAGVHALDVTGLARIGCVADCGQQLVAFVMRKQVFTHVEKMMRVAQGFLDAAPRVMSV